MSLILIIAFLDHQRPSPWHDGIAQPRIEMRQLSREP
jgi:hypothetical protein